MGLECRSGIRRKCAGRGFGTHLALGGAASCIRRSRFRGQESAAGFLRPRAGLILPFFGPLGALLVRDFEFVRVPSLLFLRISKKSEDLEDVLSRLLCFLFGFPWRICLLMR